ncbi:uveal autoantigen with coiled-coil domains and ankyrin repeats isoform 2-T2 [Rhinophrynus dorsalis]
MKSFKSRLKKHEVTITQTADWSKYDERLMRAAERGDVERISSTLAKKGVNPSKLDLEGRSAFHVVASKGHLECLNTILIHGVDLTAPDAAGRNALHLSAKYGHSLCLQKLLQFNCPTENVDLQGRTALHDAAMSDCCSSVQLLCEHGASVNAKDGDGRTPLSLATQMCRPAICQLLIEKGADVNARDKQNKTALMLGCEYGCREAVDVLLTAGADVRLVDSLGHDCAYYSRIGDNLEILSLIRTTMENSPRGTEPVRRIVSLRTRQTKQNSLEERNLRSKEQAQDLESENEDLREKLRKIQHDHRALFDRVEGLQLQLSQEQMMSDDLENEKEELKSLLQAKEKELEDSLRTMESLRGKVRYYEKSHLAQSSPFTNGKDEMVMKTNLPLGADPQLAAHLPARSQLRPLELPGENADQRQELETMRRFYEVAREEAMRLQQELSRRSSECLALASDRDRSKAESDQQIRQLEEALRDVQKRMLDSEGKVKQMQSHFLALKDHLTQEALSGSSRAEDLQDQLQEVKGKYEGASAEVGKLRNQLRHNELLVQELRREDARLRKENRRLQDELAVCEEDKERAERMAQEAGEQLALSVTTDKFENMKCLLTNEVNEKSRGLEVADRDLGRLREELETAQREKKRADAKLEIQRKELEEFKVKNHSLGREGEKLQAEKILLQRQIEELTGQMKNQHVPAQLHAETKKAYEETIAQLSKRLAESEQNHRKTEMEWEKLQEEKMTLREDMRLLQASSTPREEHEKELNSMKSSLTLLKKQLADVTRKCEEETARACSLLSENTNLRENYLPLSTHQRTTATLTTELDSMKEELKLRKKNLEKEFEEKLALQSLLQSEAKKQKELQGQVENGARERAKLKSQLESTVGERAELQVQMDRGAAELLELRSQMDNLKIGLAADYVCRKEHEEKVSELQKKEQECIQTHAKYQQTQEEVLRLQAAIQDQRQELDTLQHCITKKYAPLASMEEKEQKFKASIGTLETKMQEQLLQCKETQDQLEQQQHEMQKLQKELESTKTVLKEERATWEMEERTMRSKLDELHTCLQKLQKSEAEAMEREQAVKAERVQIEHKLRELQERLSSQYIPAELHEELKVTLNNTRTSLETALRAQINLCGEMQEKVQSLEKELENQRVCSVSLVQHTQQKEIWEKREALTLQKLQDKDETVREVEQQMKLLKDEVCAAHHRIQELQRSTADHTAVRTELEQRVAQLEETSSKYKEETKRVTQELQSARADNSAAKQALEQRVAQLEATNSKYKEEANLVTQKLQRASVDCSTVRTELELRIAQLEETNRKYKEEAEQVTQELQRASTDHAAVKIQLEQKVAQLEETSNMYKVEVERVMQELQRATADHTVAKVELEQRVAQLEETSSKYKEEAKRVTQELQRSITDHTAARMELEQSIAQLGETNNKYKEEAKQVTQQLLEAQEQSERLQEKSNLIEQEMAQIKRRYDQSMVTIEELQGRIQQSTKNLEYKDKEISALLKDVERLKLSMSQLAGSPGKSQSVETLQSQVVSLQSQLDETRHRHQEIISVYRSHLLSAVQGHMDADVQDALLQIIHMRQELVC